MARLASTSRRSFEGHRSSAVSIRRRAHHKGGMRWLGKVIRNRVINLQPRRPRPLAFPNRSQRQLRRFLVELRRCTDRTMAVRSLQQ